MNPGSAAAGSPGPAARSLRGTVALIIVGAVLFMTGLITGSVAEIAHVTTRQPSRQPAGGTAGLPATVAVAVILAAAGLALGLAALVMIVAGLPVPARRAAARVAAAQPGAARPSAARSFAARPAGSRPASARRAGARRAGARPGPSRSAPGRPRPDDDIATGDWLGPLRDEPRQPGAPAPAAHSGHPHQPAAPGYSDDGWNPDFLSGPLPACQGAQAHAAGPQSGNATHPVPPYPEEQPPEAPPGPGAAPLAAVPGAASRARRAREVPRRQRRLIRGYVVPATEAGDQAAAPAGTERDGARQPG